MDNNNVLIDVNELKAKFFDALVNDALEEDCEPKEIVSSILADWDFLSMVYEIDTKK